MHIPLPTVQSASACARVNVTAWVMIRRLRIKGEMKRVMHQEVAMARFCHASCNSCFSAPINPISLIQAREITSARRLLINFLIFPSLRKAFVGAQMQNRSGLMGHYIVLSPNGKFPYRLFPSYIFPFLSASVSLLLKHLQNYLLDCVLGLVI